MENKIDIIVAIQSIPPTNPNHAKWIYAALSKETNSLSPLVVSKPNIPLLGVPPGTFFSQRIIPVRQIAINTKNAAVCHVQAIQVINSKSKKPFSLDSETESQFANNNTLSDGIIIILYLMQTLSLYNF